MPQGGLCKPPARPVVMIARPPQEHAAQTGAVSQKSKKDKKPLHFPEKYDIVNNWWELFVFAVSCPRAEARPAAFEAT